ncbi:hypothetical protein ACAF76_004710 [Brevibacillus sp. TJ4]|uniref:hypothetical protein n=1 Tax=Brevibacillus sp. TJ4 TaxID=3234853 RepID=UPI0037CF9A7F
MTWLSVAGVSLFVALMVGNEWRHLSSERKKERTALIAVAVLGWLPAVLLLFFPKMPGPIELVDWLCKPLTSMLK